MVACLHYRPHGARWSKSCFMGLALLSLVLNLGCPSKDREAPNSNDVVEEPAVPLTMLLIGNDVSTGELIERQWSAQRDGKLTISTVSPKEFFAGEGSIDGSIDVMIFPPGMIGELESRKLLQPVPKWLLDSEDLNRNEFLSHHRRTLTRRGNKNWAISLGAPQLVMFYNTQTLRQLDIEPPENWEDFLNLKEALGKAENLQTEEGEPLPTTIDLPTAKDWAAQAYLARVAPLIRNRGKLSTVFDRKTMEPLIREPPFVKALQEIKTVVDFNTDAADLGPQEIYQRLLAGESAVGLTWPCDAFGNDQVNEAAASNLVLRRLPSSEQWFDFKEGKWSLRLQGDPSHVDLIGFTGLTCAVSASSRNTREAFEFIEWLASKSVNLITVAGTRESGPFRASHLGDPVRWTGDCISDQAAMQYADIIRDINAQDVVLLFPRIPGRRQYLARLDDAVRSCLNGQVTAEDALARCAEDWDEITESLGRKKQISELRKAAGL
jgi:ABC-type glycerol-3-phosphate transport system substrate-binding protein